MNMDHGHLDIGGAAFWIFLAVVLWASHWEKARRNAEKHETLRRIIEKTGAIDEATLKEVFAPPPASDWWKSPPSVPGSGARALRITGCIFMGIGAALATFSAIIRLFGSPSGQNGSTIGLAMSFAIIFLGLAIFFSSRYASRPIDQGNDR
jgi:hypothetical protein